MNNGNPIKFKVQGKESSHHYSNCCLSSTFFDRRLFALNNKYLVIAWKDLGTIKLVDSNHPKNLLLNDSSKFACEKSSILDMEFSPINDGILSFSYENNKVYVSKIVELDENTIDITSGFYSNHFKKFSFINFNPVALNTMLSGTSSGEIDVWDSKEFKTYTSLKLQNNPNSILWSPNGDLIGISMKNNFFDIYDPRMKKIANQIHISYCNANLKFAWLDNNTVATIGWARSNDKILGLLDLRKNNNLKFSNNFFASISIDKKNTLTIPYVNPELKLIYTIGKEESYIKVFDYNTGFIEKNSEFKASELNKSSLMLNRQYLNKKDSEVDRFMRYTKDRNIYYISFYLQNYLNFENFDGILYPEQNLSIPQMTHQDWVEGKTLETIPNQTYRTMTTQNNKENKFSRNTSYKGFSKNSYSQQYLLKQQNQNNKMSYNQLKISQTPNRNLSRQHSPYNQNFLKLKKDYIVLSTEYKKALNLLKEKEEKEKKEKEYNIENSSLKEKYKQEINRYKNLLENKNNSNLSSQERDIKYKELEKKFKEQQQIINDFKKNEEKLKKIIADLEDKINQNYSLLKQKEFENNKNINTINSLNEEKMNLEQSCESKENELNNIKKEINNSKKENEKIYNNNFEFEKQKKMLEKNINEINIKYNDIKNKYEDLQNKFQELTKENEYYKEYKKNFEKQKTRNEDLNQQISQNQEILMRNKEKINKLKKENNELLNKNNALLEIDKQNLELKQNIEKQNSQILEIQKDIDIKETNINILNDELERIKQENENLNKNLTKNTNEINSLKLINEQLNQNYEEGKIKIGNLEKEKEKLTQLDKKNEDKIKELSEAMKIYQERESQNKINEESIKNNYNQQITELKEKIEKLKLELDESHNQLMEKEKKFQDLNNKLLEKENNKNNLQIQNELIEKLQNESIIYQNEIANLKSDNEQKEKNIQKKIEECKEISKQLEQERNNNKELKNEYDKKLKELNTKIELNKKTENIKKISENNLLNKIKEYKMKTSILEKEIETKNKEIINNQNINKDKEKLVKNLKTTIIDLKKEIEGKKNTEQIDGNSLNELKEEIEKLKNDNHDLEEKKSDDERLINDLKAQNGEYEQKIFELNTIINNIKAESTKKDNQLKQLNSIMLNDKNKSEIIAQNQNKISILEQEIMQLKSFMDISRKTTKEKDNTISMFFLPSHNNSFSQSQIIKLKEETKEKEKILLEKRELELSKISLENEIKAEKTQNLKIKKNLEEMTKKYDELKNQSQIDINKLLLTQEENYILQIYNNEIEKSKLNDKINELKKVIKEKEEMIKINEEELMNFKNKNNNMENNINAKIKIIEENYKKKFNEEVYKSTNQLINSIRDYLCEYKNYYNERFEDRSKQYDSKFDELNKYILNSKLSLNNEIKKENKKQNLVNINNNIQNINNIIDHNHVEVATNNQNNNNDTNIINQNNLNFINPNINPNIINNAPRNDTKLESEIQIKNSNNTKNTSNNTFDILKNINMINNENIINNNQDPNYNEGEYLYECTNIDFLDVDIYQGSKDAKFEIYLRNNGVKKWAQDSKLIIEQGSDLNTDVVILEPQRQNEERSYKVIVKNLHNFSVGVYKVIFLFFSGGRTHGDKIVAKIKIKDKNKEKNEIEENINKIKEFREIFNLSEQEYPNEKVLKVLKDNDFNKENAFSSIFN